MRKWTACILAALCVFGLFGCGAKSVPSLDEVKDYAPVDYEERFKGVTREALTEVWGEPADGGALHRGGGAVPAALRAGAGALRQPSQGRRAGTDGDKGTLPAGGRAAGALGASGIAGAL